MLKMFAAFYKSNNILVDSSFGFFITEILNRKFYFLIKLPLDNQMYMFKLETHSKLLLFNWCMEDRFYAFNKILNNKLPMFNLFINEKFLVYKMHLCDKVFVLEYNKVTNSFKHIKTSYILDNLIKQQVYMYPTKSAYVSYERLYSYYK